MPHAKGVTMFQHYRQVRFGNMSWRTRAGLFLGIAVAVALAAALAVLSIGLALILLPIVALGLLIGRWRLNKLMAEARERGDWPPGAGRTIEIDYTRVDDERR
jgi:hypothetical protein